MSSLPPAVCRPLPLHLCALAGVVVALPLAWPAATVPDAVFLHQLLALAGWGLWLGLGLRPGEAHCAPRAWQAAAAALTLCALFAVVAGQHTDGLVLAAALAVLWSAAGVGATGAPAMAWAWWLAGMACVAVAVVQYFAPSLADGLLVASNSSPGRAVGNMRQPNHLATALLCALVMTAWLWQARRLPARWAALSMAALVLAVALSASRTGALSLGLLLLWAAVDQRLPRGARWALALAPLGYLGAWAGLAQYAEWQHAQFFAAERLQAGGDISSSRFAIWHNALALVAQNPWTGVGWGGFNFAWTFTAFPDRPVAFFDHTHNLPLQLAVEIGLPATAAVLGLLGWALWRARGAWEAGAAGGNADGMARAALVMLAVLGMHSLLEYPLWYGYFLLPAAWALGVFLGAAPARDAGHRGATATTGVAVQRGAGALMLAVAVYAGWDHRRVEVIFAPAPGAAPLVERIADGRRSLLFGHHADYAAVTNEPRDQRLESFRRPLQQLVDVRLLIAYIEALRANGREAEALYAAQRLREFRRPDAQAYFADCRADNLAPPFQCETRPVALGWRDLMP